MAKVGRPSLLTPEKRTQLLAAIRMGATREAAAVAAGIGRSTFLGWLAKGRRAKRGEYRDFLDAMQEAEAQAELLHVRNIANASNGVPGALVYDKKGQLVSVAIPGDWRASAWLLERRHPKRYGKQEKHTIAGDKDAPAVFTLDVGGLPGAAPAPAEEE